jgi:hypothetical protein
VTSQKHGSIDLRVGHRDGVAPAAGGAGVNEESSGYAAARVNYRLMANAVWTTEELKAATR